MGSLRIRKSNNVCKYAESYQAFLLNWLLIKVRWNVIAETKGGNKNNVISLGAHTDSVEAGRLFLSFQKPMNEKVTEHILCEKAQELMTTVRGQSVI